MKDTPQGGVVMLLERVKVASQAASEHHWLLIKADGINVPSNIMTCGMMEIFALRSRRPNLRASIPSMTILPVGSASRKRAVTILDLPAPGRNPHESCR